MKPFIEIEHTADTALRIYGNSLEELFINAAKGFYYLASVPVKKTSFAYRDIFIEENSIEDLLISFLNELNYYLMVHSNIFSEFKDLSIKKEKNNWNLYCKGKTITLEADKLSDIQEIKAVTYHQIEIENKDGIFSTQIIFDI